MKAVVVEIRKDNAALLSDDGCIVRVKNKNYQIGQEIETSLKTNVKFKKVAIFAAAACFALFIGGVATAYYVPSTYVSLDVNPSIEFSLNIFNRVLSVNGVNDDGSEIIEEIELSNLSNKTIDEAIAMVIDQITEDGYLNGEGNGIVLTTSAKDLKRAAELAENLEDVATETVEENDLEAEVNAEAVGAQRVAQARELEVTPGKLNLVEKLIESAEDPESVDMNYWLDQSVKDIMAQTNENKEQNKDEESNSTSEASNSFSSESSSSESSSSSSSESSSSNSSATSSSSSSKSNNGKGKGKDNGGQS